VDERIVNNMNDKHFNNKISLWIKQRLFPSRKYDETMSSLEKFVDDMKKLDEIAVLEREQQEQIIQQEQIVQPDKKLTDDEQRRFSLILPPLAG
jgi:hypothetical protein